MRLVRVGLKLGQTHMVIPGVVDPDFVIGVPPASEHSFTASGDIRRDRPCGVGLADCAFEIAVALADNAVHVVSGGWEWFVGVGEDCGQAGEQQIEAPVEFGSAVIGG